MKGKRTNVAIVLVLLSTLLFTVATAANVRLPETEGAPTSIRADGDPQPVAAEDVTALGAGIVSEPKGSTGEAIYLIRLQDPPLAAYDGGIDGLAPTSPGVTAERRLDVDAPASRAYIRHLQSEQANLIGGMESLLGRSIDVIYHYTNANNGIAVQLTPDEARLVSGMPGVVFVQRDLERELETDNGPAWIGAPGIWDDLAGNQGEGIIIGVIDTGINPDNPSFAAVGPNDGYVHVNPYGSGNYTPGSYCDDPAVTFCNDKLIGAWDYVNGGDPTDTDGHGSHTASTAAGNFVTATVEAPTATFTRTISGVAPHANIIAYSACCTLSALSAAIDQVIADGVDVVNYSIGSTAPSNVWSDFDTVGFLNAREAGIFVATSAGNEGPSSETVGSPADAPWLLSVGATTHDREFLNSLANLEPEDTTPPADMRGKSITGGYGPAPIVHASSAGDGQCLSAFTAGTWSGEIVVCDRGEIARVQKCINVEAGGAGGCVLANIDEQGESISADPHVIPAVHIGDADGDVLRNWLSSGTGHTATIVGTVLREDAGNADIMAGFSSRGANRALPDIIVPSVSAPGVDIIAAYGTSGAVEWNAISGTSMASPHAAGAAALLIALHPEWTPAMVQSALMTSSWTDVLDDDGSTPATYFDKGSGRIDLTQAAEVGFVMDESIAHYEAADPDLGGDPKTLNLPSMGNSECFASCSWTRTISSTVDIPVTWTASGTSDDNVNLSISPAEFELPAYGTQVIEVTADVSSATNDVWAFSEVTLSPSETAVADGHLPVAVIPTAGVIPDTVEIETRRSAGSHLIEDLEAIEITDLTIANYGLVQALQTTEPLSQDPTNDNPYDNFNDGTTFYITHTVPAGAERLVAEIIDSDAPDIDLFVGTGSTPSEASTVCTSTTPTAAEYCNVDDPAVGTWWILVQNWSESGSPPDGVTLASAVVPGSTSGNISVTGPNSVGAQEPFDLRVYWDDADIAVGDRWYGAFDIASNPGDSDDVGTIRIDLNRYAGPVVKSASNTTPAAGQTYTYSLTVLPNVTGADLAYTITDTIPAGLAYVPGTASATDGSVNVSGNQLTWTGTMLGSRYYAMTTSEQDSACAAPFANSGAYVDLAAFGIYANPGVTGDSTGFVAFTEGDPINYYGVDYTGMGFTDDGFAIFDFDNYGGLPWNPQALPEPALPNNVLPAFWHDFEIVYDAAQNYGVSLATSDASGGLVIIEYDDIHLFADDNPSSIMDFEIAMMRSPRDSAGAYEIVYAYDNISSIPSPATIGLENVLGTRATVVVNAGDASGTISDGMAICFDWVQPATPTIITYQVEVIEDSCTTVTNTAEHAVDNPGSLPASVNHSVLPNCVTPSSANLDIDSPIDENDTVTLSGDIDEPNTGETVQLDVDWGDGTVTSYTYPGGTTSFAETHQYLDDDPTGTPSDVYTVSLSLSDSIGLSTTTSISLTVNNVPPTVDAGADVTTDAGVPIAFRATATDVGTLDTQTYEWDFGDGNTATGTAATHSYATDGFYDVTLTVTDDDNGVGTDTLRVRVGGNSIFLPAIRGYRSLPSPNGETPEAAAETSSGNPPLQGAIWASIALAVVLPVGGILHRRR